MSEPLIKHRISGIKCDNPKCDFRDDTVKMEDYEQWLNKPCPKCGANLLTEEDLKATEALLEVVGAMNRVGEILGVEVQPDEKRVPIKIHMDGTGFAGMRVEAPRKKSRWQRFVDWWNELGDDDTL